MRRRVLGRAVAVAVLGGLLAACSGSSPSTLSAAGAGARTVAGLSWLLFAIASVVCLVVIGCVLWAVATRQGARPSPGGTRVVVIAGVVIPALILTAVYLVGLSDQKSLAVPSDRSALTVDVTGHLWWWEVRYPAAGGVGEAVTANEIHVPVGRTVLVRLTTADVNHSFWVPQLMPKRDLVAGRVNETWLRADKAGTYRGQCAEYCGLQHAHMAFLVVAQPPAQFEAWLRRQASPVAAPAGALAARGLQVFESASCASCHTVRGTTAHGKVGPDLTHLADRRQLGAGAVANTTGYLGGWISNSQAIKPGNKMPPQPLSPDDLRAVVAFLDGGTGRPSPGGPATSGGSGSPSGSTTPTPGAGAQGGAG